jgi:uncharacterized membrane protein YcaP (DUF421 family)
MTKLHEALIYIFGEDKLYPDFLHMCARFTLVYLIGIVSIRASRRFIGMRTSFNLALFIISGSAFAASITGNAAFFQTILAVIVTLQINHILATLVYYFPRFELLVKGHRYTLIEDGVIQWKNLRINSISHNELMIAVHTQAHTTNLKKIRYAFFENNGVISIILYDQDTT